MALLILSVVFMAVAQANALMVPGVIKSGVTPEQATAAATAIPVLSLSGRLCIGLLGDTFDKRYLLAASFGMQAVGLALLAVPSNGALLWPFVLLFSAGYGGPIPLRTGIQAEHFGGAALGTIQGMVLFIISIGTLLGPIVVGWLVDQTGEYYSGFLLAAAMVGLAAVLVLLVPRARRGASAWGRPRCTSARSGYRSAGCAPNSVACAGSNVTCGWPFKAPARAMPGMRRSCT